MMKWKNKLKVYLAPFLHGMRYTSFGRHFTKIDKLEKVVDMLHWYAQEGDTIMGLNPPFGVKAALANKFVDKALKFRPKLIILIVPQETERLDKKDPPHDLIFEDNELLAGRSFYLPGSVDINDKQMDQWNNNPPPLYFWSRRDWTVKHNAIAQQHGHLHRRQEESRMVDNCKDICVHNFPSQDYKFSTETPFQSDVHYLTAEKAELKENANNVKECFKVVFPSDLVCSGPENHHGCINQLNENSNKICRSEEKQRIGSAELPQEDEQKRRGVSPDDKQKKGGSGDEQKKRVSGKAFVDDKKKRGGSGEVSLEQSKRGLGDILAEDKKRRGSGEMSLKQRKRVSGDILPEDNKKRGGSGETLLEVEKKKNGSGEISLEEKKKQGSGWILAEGKNKRVGSLETLPEDRKKRRGNEISPDSLPEVRHNRRGSHEVSPVERQNTSFLPHQRQPVGSPSLAGVQAEGYHHFDSRVSRLRQISPEILSDVRQKRRGSREVSPMERLYTNTLHRQFQPVESSSLAGVQTESYHHFDSRTSGSHQFGAVYNGIQEDNVSHMYGDSNVDLYQSSIYRERISEPQLPGYPRESTDYHSYMSCIDNSSSQKSNYLASHVPGIPTPYENFGSLPNLSSNRSIPDSSYNRTSTSAMQRYAPRLDELNQPRVNNLGSDPAFPTSGNYDLRAPRPPYQGNSMTSKPIF